PAVRRMINQALFERLYVSTPLLRKARVTGAEFKEPLTLLARDLPEHVLQQQPRLSELVSRLCFSEVGWNSDWMVPPAGLEPCCLTSSDAIVSHTDEPSS